MTELSSTPKPLIGVVMGSKSDWDTLRHTQEVLDQFDVPHECCIISAHRTPIKLAEYASSVENRGLEVIIAGAGGAAPHERAAGRRRGPGVPRDLHGADGLRPLAGYPEREARFPGGGESHGPDPGPAPGA